jgi:hypothetical protein
MHWTWEGQDTKERMSTTQNCGIKDFRCGEGSQCPNCGKIEIVCGSGIFGFESNRRVKFDFDMYYMYLTTNSNISATMHYQCTSKIKIQYVTFYHTSTLQRT